jgi:hypothetical protein
VSNKSSVESALTFACDICEQKHDIPLHLAFSMPDFVSKLLPWDREKRCQLTEDWCIVDDSLYYVRGCLELPIEGTEHTFSWGVWATLNEADFDRTSELWDAPDRSAEPPYQGTIANTIPSYLETRGLAAEVQTREVGERPSVTVIDRTHKLFHEQKNGMPLERAIELAKVLLHAPNNNPYGYLCER